MLPLARTPALFVVDNALSGFISGLLVVIFSSKARRDYDGPHLRTVFHHFGVYGKYGEWVGSGLAGLLLLLYQGVPTLYEVSGLGIIAVAVAALPLCKK